MLEFTQPPQHTLTFTGCPKHTMSNTNTEWKKYSIPTGLNPSDCKFGKFFVKIDNWDVLDALEELEKLSQEGIRHSSNSFLHVLHLTILRQ